ncbi:MAG: arginine deiminase-related protein [Flavobacteriales bacterium]|nr:arginine deiminase-related protein [Flavobacteriales bacterium]MDG1779501.1 arginine deiminase-related protein [Flavobacteriales bacterium]MDG2245251.1 arginine deiminase-related protein [Flavobacteriales bacterium]
MRQSSAHFLMVRPTNFRMNEETAKDNLFQETNLSLPKASVEAEKEFDRFVKELRDKGIKVMVDQFPSDIDAPDALFPNNWVSFHEDGKVGLYPMLTSNRRVERRESVLDRVQNEFGLEIKEVIDFTEFEEHDKFLEGTGSLVLDRKHRVAYACLSERTDKQAVTHFCEQMNYRPVMFRAFHAVDGTNHPIYHTNVMMCIASAFVLICLDSITDETERQSVVDAILATDREIIELTADQMNNFAGNALEVTNEEGLLYLVLSERALNSLDQNQVDRINRHLKIIAPNLATIEKLGGGSARCMMCEVFLPKF